MARGRSGNRRNARTGRRGVPRNTPPLRQPENPRGESRTKTRRHAEHSLRRLLADGSASSYVARLIADAGGQYVYTQDTGNQSRPIDTEEAYRLAEMSDCWINVGSAASLKELAEIVPNSWIRAPCGKGGSITTTGAPILGRQRLLGIGRHTPGPDSARSDPHLPPGIDGCRTDLLPKTELNRCNGGSASSFSCSEFWRRYFSSSISRSEPYPSRSAKSSPH